MRLPGNFRRFFKKKDKEQNLLLAVLFEQARITAAVFSSEQARAKILSFRQAPYDGEIDESVEIIDHLLAGLADEVPEVEHIENTIFGFPKEFVAKDKIKPEILDKLKKVIKQLSLEPKGFVVLSEALAYYLSSQSGAQESAIFVGVFPGEVRISLLKIGKIIDEKKIARTDNICFDVETALNSFNQEVLPAKIILYDSTQMLESVKNEFLKYPWEKKCQFLHFPKIDILPVFAALEAVIGAYTDKDTIVLKEETIVLDTEDAATEIVEPEKLGFSPSTQSMPDHAQTRGKKEELSPAKRRFSIKFKPGLPGVSLAGLPGKRWIVLFCVVLAAIGGGWWFATAYTGAARVRILVDPKTFDQELEFTLDPTATTVDTEKRIIPGKKISIEMKGEETKDTTGTKLIGERAQGKVVIYNKTTQEKSFAKDAILVTPDKLRFSLGEDVKVASASVRIEGDKETKTYGKKDATAQAVEIGPEGNIAKDTRMMFEEYSQDNYAAQVIEEFSGGTSREVSVVSADDVRELRKRILTKLRKEAKTKIASQKGDNFTVIEETTEEEATAESLSAKKGEQAKTVTLKATVRFTSLAFNSEDIAKLLQENARSKIPEGYVMQGGKSRQKILDKTVNDDGSVNFRSSFATTLIPEFNTEELRSKAVGMGIAEFGEYLRKQKHVGELEIVFDNKLPFFSPRSLPSDPDKITIAVTSR